MRKFITKILQFLFISLIVYPILIFLWGYFIKPDINQNLFYKKGSYGHIFTRLAEVKQTKDIDILFIGSSQTYRGFDTRIFKKEGYTTFNLGTSAQTPIQSNLLLKRYLERLNPKLVIFEVYPESFILDGAESAVDIYANDNIDINSLKMAFEINNILVYNTLIYAYFHDLIKVNSNFTEPNKIKDDTYIEGGYVDKKVKHFKYLTYLKETELVFQDYQIENFKKNISMVKEKDIEYILVFSPITKVLYDRYTNHDFIDSLYESQGTYYDFHNILNLDDSLHFYNRNHLNQDGVNIFNKKLIEIIKKE